MSDASLPLDGIRVLDFAQFLAGPMAALRLADMGAEVIKIERPGSGDACRQLIVADQTMAGDSLLFHTINRGKKSVAADLKNPDDLASLKRLIQTADVMIHSFRPGVMERLGLGVLTTQELNPRLVIGVVSGYGNGGPWRDKPGQDLLAQSRSGLVWLTGIRSDPPVPVGVSITDITAGAHLAQGILAALLRRERTGKCAVVEVSLLSSAMDLQFEQFTSYLNSSRTMPERSALGGANVHAAAPYGIYETADGYLAIAMTPVASLAGLLHIEDLRKFTDPGVAFKERDVIKTVLREALRTKPTAHWLDLLEPADIWCAQVLDWPQLQASGALDELGVVQTVTGDDGQSMQTTTCPIRFDGQALKSGSGAPTLGRHTEQYLSTE